MEQIVKGLARGQEDQRGKIPSFETIKLDSLAALMKAQLNDEGSFLYIADLEGRCIDQLKKDKNIIFFDVGKEYLDCISHKSDFISGANRIRGCILKAMENDKQVVLSLGLGMP